MISQLIVLAHQVENRTYHFLCAPDSPLHEIQEALGTFIQKIAQLEANQRAATEKAQEDNKKIENQNIEGENVESSI
jgi:hypothetical protein